MGKNPDHPSGTSSSGLYLPLRTRMPTSTNVQTVVEGIIFRHHGNSAQYAELLFGGTTKTAFQKSNELMALIRVARRQEEKIFFIDAYILFCEKEFGRITHLPEQAKKELARKWLYRIMYGEYAIRIASNTPEHKAFWAKWENEFLRVIGKDPTEKASLSLGEVLDTNQAGFDFSIDYPEKQ